MSKQIFAWDYSRMTSAEFKAECFKDPWSKLAFMDILKYIHRMSTANCPVTLDRYSWEAESARRALSGYFYAKNNWLCFDYCTHLVDILYRAWSRNAKRISQS